MIPESTLRLARDIIALQARALAEHKMLTAASEQASGAEAVGKAALAAELEQVGKVLSNYMPRIMKHVGELTPQTDEAPMEILDLLRENEPHGEARERLWTLFRNAQTLIADNGKNLPSPTSDDYMLFARLYPHLGWMAKSGAVEVI